MLAWEARLICILLALLHLGSPAQAREARVVHTARLDLSGLPVLELPAPEALLDHLARSPHWSVTRDRDGSPVASLRTVQQVAPMGIVVSWDPDRPALNAWLPEWLAAGTPPPQSSDMLAAVSNGGLRLDGAILSVTVHSGVPEGAVVVPATPEARQALTVPVVQPFSGDGLDGNAWSLLSLPLGGELWLSVREQGPSTDRTVSRGALTAALTDLQRVASLPADYRARDVYAPVFTALGGLETHPLRYPGLQDRDTLGLVFEVPPDRDLQGVHVHVYDEAVCHGECTVGYRQLAKAELLGHPPAGDLALVVASDCAVMLDAEGSARYGTFSGSGPFEAEIRWLDAAGGTLHSSPGPFRGWER